MEWDNVSEITRKVQEIRRSIRLDKRGVDQVVKQQFERALTNYAQELSRLSERNRIKEVDKAQKLICEISKELATMSSEDGEKKKSKDIIAEVEQSVKKIRRDLENESIEKLQFENIETSLQFFENKLNCIRKKSNEKKVDKTLKLVKEVQTELERLKYTRQELQNKHASETITEIENQIARIETKIQDILSSNSNVEALTSAKEELEQLMALAASVEETSNSIMLERKSILEKNLLRLHKKISRMQDSKNSEEQSIAQNIQQLQKIDGIISNMELTENLAMLKTQVEKYKHQVIAIKELNGEVRSLKSKVFDKLEDFAEAIRERESKHRVSRFSQYPDVVGGAHFGAKAHADDFPPSTYDDLKYLQQSFENLTVRFEENNKLFHKVLNRSSFSHLEVPSTDEIHINLQALQRQIEDYYQCRYPADDYRVLTEKLQSYRKTLEDLGRKSKRQSASDLIHFADILMQQLQDKVQQDISPESAILSKVQKRIERIQMELLQAQSVQKCQSLDGQLILCIVTLDNLTVDNEDVQERRRTLHKEINDCIERIAAKILALEKNRACVGANKAEVLDAE